MKFERLNPRPRGSRDFGKKTFFAVWAEAYPANKRSRRLLAGWFVGVAERGAPWQQTHGRYRVLIDGPFRTRKIASAYVRAHRHAKQCHEHEDCVMNLDLGVACQERKWSQWS